MTLMMRCRRNLEEVSDRELYERLVEQARTNRIFAINVDDVCMELHFHDGFPCLFLKGENGRIVRKIHDIRKSQMMYYITFEGVSGIGTDVVNFAEIRLL